MLVLHPSYTFPNGVNFYLLSAVLYFTKKNQTKENEVKCEINVHEQLVTTTLIILFFHSFIDRTLYSYAILVLMCSIICKRNSPLKVVFIEITSNVK